MFLSAFNHYDTPLLNQERAGRRSVHAWCLRIVSVRMYACACVCVCVCVCVPPRLLITSGVMWCDIDPIRLVNSMTFIWQL